MAAGGCSTLLKGQGVGGFNYEENADRQRKGEQ